MRRLASLALAAGMAVLTSGEAFAVDWLFPTSNRESRFCDDSGILQRVQRGFRHGVLNVPNLPNVSIVAFHGIHEHRYQPFGDEQPIARRYCGATAEMSDGRMREVWYLIEDRMGFVGVGDGVEWCVSGFDRWKVYNGHCRVLR
jgi:hypothetical protein